MTNEQKTEVTREHWEAQLNVHLRFLQKSADEYDKGDFAEALRMATEICKLVGDRYDALGNIRESSRSLTQRLGIKPTTVTDLSVPGLLAFTHLHGPATTMAFTLSHCDGMAPILDGFIDYPDHWQPRTISFEDWWTAPVIRDSEGRMSSRGDILFHMRDKESVHTDDRFLSGYAALSLDNSFGMTSFHTTPATFDKNPGRVVVRQAAHELLRTLLANYPKRYSFGPPLLVQPIALLQLEISDEDEASYLHELPSGFRIVTEQTSDSDIWSDWRKPLNIASIAEYRNGDADRLAPNQDRLGFDGIRIVFLSYAPYPVEINGSAVDWPNEALYPLIGRD